MFPLTDSKTVLLENILKRSQIPQSVQSQEVKIQPKILAWKVKQVEDFSLKS